MGALAPDVALATPSHIALTVPDMALDPDVALATPSHTALTVLDMAVLEKSLKEFAVQRIAVVAQDNTKMIGNVNEILQASICDIVKTISIIIDEKCNPKCMPESVPSVPDEALASPSCMALTVPDVALATVTLPDVALAAQSQVHSTVPDVALTVPDLALATPFQMALTVPDTALAPDMALATQSPKASTVPEKASEMKRYQFRRTSTALLDDDDPFGNFDDMEPVDDLHDELDDAQHNYLQRLVELESRGPVVGLPLHEVVSSDSSDSENEDFASEAPRLQSNVAEGFAPSNWALCGTKLPGCASSASASLCTETEARCSAVCWNGRDSVLQSRENH